MRVAVDTSVWSAYLRRKRELRVGAVEQLKALLAEDRAVVLGVVKQELLSGVSDPKRFDLLLSALSGFETLLADEADHILAAKFFNVCRSKGIQGSFGDFLICALAVRHRMSILTLDRDFEAYARALPIILHEKT